MSSSRKPRSSKSRRASPPLPSGKRARKRNEPGTDFSVPGSFRFRPRGEDFSSSSSRPPAVGRLRFPRNEGGRLALALRRPLQPTPAGQPHGPRRCGGPEHSAGYSKLFADTHRTQKHAWGFFFFLPPTLPDAHLVLAWLRLAQLHKNATFWQDFLQISGYEAKNSGLRIDPAARSPLFRAREKWFSTPPLLGIELCGKPTRPGAVEKRRSVRCQAKRRHRRGRKYR